MDAAPIRPPDLSARPFSLAVEHIMSASPDELYRMATRQLGLWFADPGSVRMRPAVNEPFFFTAGGGHPHYGRFLRLIPDRLVELTWVTGPGGTEGAETVLTLELSALGAGSALLLTHAGFPSAAARDRHEKSWPQVLDRWDQRTLAVS
ncbi:SRPBCC domain-containing protein [Nocardia sp. SYP-A9097]|uniref:SRPBCC family protein n=1 Tax=Nocardia sp. SYP-A9097 TaxID=2663237 RepID=UPI00129A5FD2|nr:SRPBCC domain-containing protein [Nocardia sp. SYP-A9097]MRH90404.1 SRPBCC domain-containing protein [Nocardia sp. SYP-A9097]